MKNLKIKYFLMFVLSFTAITSCSDNFLEPEAPGTLVESNFYKTDADAFGALIATYDVMRKQSSGFENMVTMMNAGSDDHFAGGGNTFADGINFFGDYSIKWNPTTVPASFWNDFYQGIFRANTLLVKIPAINMDAAKKARFTAEAKTLRAFYYFDLIRLFENIPLLTKPIGPNQILSITQSSKTNVYAQIEKDLNEAIADLPLIITDKTNEGGRFSQGSAKALLGKVYLFQGKDALAASILADVNGIPGGTSQYGYKLMSTFASLWTPSSKFNSESIIEVSHSNEANTNYSTWGSGSDEGNLINQMVGARNYLSKSILAPNYSSGWSFNPVTPDLYNFMKLDPRFSSTIADLKALKTANRIDYSASHQDTGYFLKKFMPLKTDESGTIKDLNFKQNYVVLRLADTYLMEAEALGGTGSRAQALLNAVRTRVGLPSIPVSINAIWNERRLELAGEGHRWFDLVRTNRAATVLASRGFIAGKHEVWPIPQAETVNTNIIQNLQYR